MAQNIEVARARAEAIFKTADAQARPGLNATPQMIEERATREKIDRLRALRLAKQQGALTS